MAIRTFQLTRAVRAARETERRRIAAELHDGIGQQLCAIKLKLEMFLDRCTRNGVGLRDQELQSAIEGVEQTLRELKRVSSHLTAADLPDDGCVDRLEALCDEFADLNPRVDLQRRYELDQNAVPPLLSQVIYRVAQEALNNVHKHAEATSATLKLEENACQVKLEITDDGQGSGTMSSAGDGADKHLGLASMRKRVRESGGSFNIRSGLHEGTTVEACWTKSAVAELSSG